MLTGNDQVQQGPQILHNLHIFPSRTGLAARKGPSAEEELASGSPAIVVPASVKPGEVRCACTRIFCRAAKVALV